MAQAGYTPIQLYYSSTTTNVPLAANLAAGELALNTADGKLFYKDNGGVVRVIAQTSSVTNVASISFGTTGLTPSTATTGAVTVAGTLATTNGGTGLTSFTANGVVYASSTSALTTGSALTFTGTRLGIGEASPVSALTVKSGNGDQVTLNNAGERYTQLTLQNNGTSKGALWVDNTNSLLELFGYSGVSLTFSANGSEAMRLTSTGLGIGTSSPAAKLHIESASAESFRIGYSSTKTSRLGTTSAGDLQVFAYDSAVGYKNILLAVDAGTSAGNVGIGTSSPARPLHVNGIIRADGPIDSVYTGTAAGSALGSFRAYGVGSGVTGETLIRGVLDSGSTTSSYLEFGTTSSGTLSERARITSGGNLLVGTTSDFSSARIVTSGGGIGILNRGLLRSGVDGVLQVSADPNNAYSSSYIGFDVDGSEYARITSGGDFGLGTTTPDIFARSYGRVLGISSASSASIEINAATGNAAFVDLGVNGTRYLQVYADSSVPGLFSLGAIPLGFGTNGTERARITSGGDLLVGTTSAGAGIGWSSRLAVDGSGTFGMVIKSNNANNECVDSWNSATSGTRYHIYFRDGAGATARGSITTDGANTAYNTSSDYRLKNNPQPLTGSGAFIDALKPKTWTWKETGASGVGFIAHEVQEVSPGSVTGTKDAVDEEGKPAYQAMEYGSAEFIANIIAELQSLRLRVSQLEQKA